VTIKQSVQDSDDDDDDDEVTYPLEPESSSPRKGAAPGNNIAEGKCQTCDATVRYLIIVVVVVRVPGDIFGGWLVPFSPKTSERIADRAPPSLDYTLPNTLDWKLAHAA
jgi:hypothetical protein